MSRFAVAAQRADDQRLPVVEGVTVQAMDGADDAAIAAMTTDVPRILTAQLGGVWEVRRRADRWLDATPPTNAEPPPLDRTWDAVRALARDVPSVAHAEPLLLVRVPDEDERESAARLGIWGFPYDAQTNKKIADAPRDWALARMKVPDAWARWRDRRGGGAQPGDGIRISHPDTGYTAHEQVSPIRDGTGVNYVEIDHPDDAVDGLTATDPLANPGHGTATASVIASPAREVGAERDVRGIAPGARVRPLRVSTSVVHLSFHNVTLAIEEAIASGAHIVTLALGGPLASDALRDVIGRAIDAGIIIVAAAGNYLPTVIFPAAVPGVIACAAANAADIPWRFSGLGEEVAVTAPGERIWHATAGRDGDDEVTFGEGVGDGTSYATAAVSGIAALWLSFHGRDSLIAIYSAPLLPFAFALHLRRSADATPGFIAGGKSGFGAGIADAAALLQTEPPSRDDVVAYRRDIVGHSEGSLIDLTLRELDMLFRAPTHAPDGTPLRAASAPDGASVRRLVADLLGGEPDDPAMVRELAALLASRPPLHRAALGAVRHGTGARAQPGGDPPAGRPREYTLMALRGRLLDLPLSAALRTRLDDAQAEQKRHLPRGVSVADAARRATPAAPTVRRLRAFAFDPSLAIKLETAPVNAVTIAIPFEAALEPGPVGDYLEVVDLDPATGCAYVPVDLNDPALLAQDGLPQSEGSPQFHQQMVYAVAMKTISHFEQALGRPLFWSSLRPWRGGADAARAKPLRLRDGRPDLRDQDIRRLRLYPHALRVANAYYSPEKRAILFGYFPAQEDKPGEQYPGGIVFTCLSHDIIAHEMTHAILDGMHASFIEPTNPDVFAFHEAFADIVALFQHFTYPEVLRDQIARTRGDLTNRNLLGQLAQQIGIATGEQYALRDAIGGVVAPVDGPEDALAMVREARQRRQERATPAGDAAAGAMPPPPPQEWMRYQPGPFLLPAVEEAHARGAILVAAVFDSFLSIYDRRRADLVRIATGGTGVLPSGQIHPDVVNRMANEAAKSATHVLHMCIRAMDYVPPVDITFGEFLRALITADYDLVPDDDLRYRVAFIEAFRKWGIYPRDVRTLSEQSLRWHSPEDLALFGRGGRTTTGAAHTVEPLRRALLEWQPGGARADIFAHIRDAQAALHTYLRAASITGPGPDWARALLPGIDVDDSFSVANLRPSRRIGPDGQFSTEMVFEVIQHVRDLPDQYGDAPPFAAGVTVVVSLDDWRVRYTIYKRGIDAEGRLNTTRLRRQRAYGGQQAAAMDAVTFGAAEYRCDDAEATAGDRSVDREAMRASSCRCRTKKSGGGRGPVEPFALLHRGKE